MCQSSCFCCGWRKEKLFTRKVWGLHSPWSSIRRPPFYRFMLFFSFEKPKKKFLHFRNENKTLEVWAFGLQCTMITCTFWVHDFKMKSHLSRTPKVPKNMLRKSILIGLFDLNNNRTIGGPKYPHAKAYLSSSFNHGRTGGCLKSILGTFHG